MTKQAIVRKKSKESFVPAGVTSVKSLVVKDGKHKREIMPMILNLVARHRNDSAEYQDTVAAALLGFCEAKSRFRPKMNTRLVTFAHWRIKGALKDQRKRDARYAARYIPCDPSTIDASTGRDGLERRYAFKELWRLTATIINKELNAEQNALVTGYMNGKKDRDIARDLGTTVDAVIERRAAVFAMLRGRLNSLSGGTTMRAWID